jgi:hypothetical protein
MVTNVTFSFLFLGYKKQSLSQALNKSGATKYIGKSVIKKRKKSRKLQITTGIRDAEK